MKPKISGANLSLEYENIESSLYKVSVSVVDIISQEAYDRIITNFEASTIVDIEKEAIDNLQRAMLHFAIYEHSIFLIAQIGNDGITVKKTDDNTTIYKYLQDELNQKLITTAWFWINQLIKLMNANTDVFTEWTNSVQKIELDKLPVSLSDFNKWVGVSASGGEYFMLSSSWIIREVWMDCVDSRKVEKSDAIIRALCYEVMGRACERLSYQVLPEPIRKDIDNEMSKTSKDKSSDYVKEKIAQKFRSKAETYWQAVDMQIKRAEIAAEKKTVQSQPIVGADRNEEDKFFCS